MSPDEILAIATEGAKLGCLEALFTLGDRPEDRWPGAAEWLESRGYDSTLAYIRAMAIRVLEKTGLLPHLNPGVMSWEELNRLKPVSPSMGMMLHGRIESIQTSWVKLGTEGTQAMLNAGANDLGGTLMEETISRMAGSEFGSAKTVAELTEIAAGIGRPVRERTTLYGTH